MAKACVRPGGSVSVICGAIVAARISSGWRIIDCAFRTNSVELSSHNLAFGASLPDREAGAAALSASESTFGVQGQPSDILCCR
jgi:hypothetical protein